ncbi:sel1 repeat family protein [Ectopseudomonas hydrolytica]|uniref:Sel1 repeat family protein n=1 Tax=Ectopseudomonas hydrolytica TaxID=2493633 RepID=A0ABY5A3W6_9GAMM|nr:tetratricopeptide repeat protein [Pseudomonas hydrolytica]OCX15295.1 hypothetical protein BBI09_16055 [Stutzerimonas xanthomarina]USR37663.1 sel1 repeat family protein [Pseudomonas hydrolytica]
MNAFLIRRNTLSHEELGALLNADPASAANAILSAARTGSTQAQTLLGQILLNGQGITQDQELARQWFKIAIQNSDDPAAHNMLGRCLEHGWGGEQDHSAAAAHYRRAIAAGLDWAMYNYAGLLATGRGVPRDDCQAYALYLRAAEAGHAKSMNLVGRYHEEGITVPRNPALARKWYKRSAEAGDFRGQFSYAAVLAEDRQLEQAQHWLLEALRTGNLNFLRFGRASLSLADSTAVRAIALAYYARAAEIGDETDKQALEEHIAGQPQQINT